jgi:feruloyl esterase
MRSTLMGACALACLTGLAFSASAPSARAAAACHVDALNALRTPDVTITQAKPAAATPQAPAHCEVQGTVVTRGDGAPEGSARFLMELPDDWRQRFLFLGVGGNAGNLVPSANATDRAKALGKGYVTVLTDTGHIGDGTTAQWVRKPDGSLDKAKVTDFFYRATHDVGVAGKAFATAYYAAPVLHAYYDGCSSGGRMAMMEAERYPDDYAGIIAGDPAMDYNLQVMRLTPQKAAMKSPQAFIPQETLAALDARVTALCDTIDGAKDQLVQDPARCPVNAEDLACRPGQTQACLNPDQLAVLKNYTTPMRDRAGHVIYPAWAITNLSGPQGMAAWTLGRTAPNLANPQSPWTSDQRPPSGWAFASQALIYWLGYGPTADVTKTEVDPRRNAVSDELLARNAEIFADADTKDPARLRPFIAKGGKLILYHGASDPAIPAARTVMFYRQLTAMLKGQAVTQKNVRLFLVPGMQHCGGGVGPEQFDTLSALEAWVEQGQAPAAISAITKPEMAVQHQLPLCPYPAQARYSGAGDVTDASQWSCKAPRAQGTRSSKPS